MLVRLVRPRSHVGSIALPESLLHLCPVGDTITMPAIQHSLPYAHGLLFARSSAVITPVNGTVGGGGLTEVVGWVASSRDRGTIDIMWSSCLTILLCVWMATYPNAPSPNDKWYHRFVDKANLALIGFLGPDFLLGIAVGQLVSARKSVKMFREAPELSQGTPWTLTHGFFADMGGFHLRAPDLPREFPINAEQLFYLVKHGHLDFPVLTREDIGRRSRVDGLSKIITVWQAFCWYFKPSINQATILYTKDGRTIRSIRDFARRETHPSLPHNYYRTPLDFISRRKFHIESHWRYYSELTYLVHLPLFNRQLKATPWDRFPSDTWLPVEGWIIPFVLLIQVPFSVCFLIGWNFHFPTTEERELWRVCAIYHAGFSLLGTAYYMFGSLKGACERIVPLHIFTASKVAGEGRDRSAGTGGGSNGNKVLPPLVAAEELSLTRRGTGDSGVSEVAYAPRPVVHRKTGLPRSMSRLEAWLVKWRNISPDQDPDMEVPLRWIAPILAACFIYILCRLYIYIEDFAGLRSQPLGVYMTVNKFVPFL
ncbi:hypothetical protein RB595_009652 [Gaeumannomyces hyphopodioides]